MTKFQLLRGEIDPDEVRRMSLPPASAYTLADYAAEVKAELGTFPSFNALTAGTVIPITVDGEVVPAGEHTNGMKCDRPIWLGVGSGSGYQCAPYARIGSLQGSDPQVRWIYIARRYEIRADPDHPVFEDVAVIGYHKQTGRTAFFQMLDSSGKDARRVPSPMEPASETPDGEQTAESFWLSPGQTAGIGCNRCHDVDPFIHSPYVDQVRVNGTPLVPSHPMRKYSFIGTQAFSAWPQPKHFTPDSNVCIRCHRMGQTGFTKTFVNWTTGVNPRQVGAPFDAYPLTHWMPPGESAAMSEAEWDANYRESTNQILACIQSPMDPACKLVDVPH